MPNQKASDQKSRPPTPDVAGQERLRRIRKVDLALHGDGINHWQDEPQDGKTKDGKKRKND